MVLPLFQILIEFVFLYLGDKLVPFDTLFFCFILHLWIEKLFILLEYFGNVLNDDLQINFDPSPCLLNFCEGSFYFLEFLSKFFSVFLVAHINISRNQLNLFGELLEAVSHGQGWQAIFLANLRRLSDRNCNNVGCLVLDHLHFFG